MPQMAPLMWVTLFVSFLLLLFLTSNKIMFSKIKNMNNKSNKNDMKYMNVESSSWKW